MNLLENLEMASPSSLSTHTITKEKISIVVPVTERCKNLGDIYRSHAQVLREKGYIFNFIFVFDGGFRKDGEELKADIGEDDAVHIVQLTRAFGEATALSIGFEKADGEYIICLPSYFQTVPQGIADVMDALVSGYDLVVSRRWPRVDGILNKLQNSGFHFFVRKFSGVNFHDLGCGLKGMKRQVALELQLYGDLHRFIALLAHRKGFRILEIKVPQHEMDQSLRLYGPGTYLRRLLDILTIVFLFKFTKKPLRFFGLIGAGLFAAGSLISLMLAVERILGYGELANRPLLVLGVLLMVLGVQTGSIGILGEIVIFTHARKMKEYSVDMFLK